MGHVMDEKYDRFETLRLLPGHGVQLDFDGYTQDRAKSILVGYNVMGLGQGIIVTTPVANGAPISFKVDSELTVRLFVPHLSCACAFRTKIKHISRAPYSYLHLAIPEQMVLGEVRSTVRAKVKLPTAVYCGEQMKKHYSGSIQDLSLGGARVVGKMLPLAAGDEIRLSAQVVIGDIERLLSLHGVVRSVSGEDNETILGIQFTNLNDDAKLALFGFVMSNMYK